MAQKILVIGCGGLGSELLKLLVLQNFEQIVIVDNDNIDLTNLNRQFLYIKKHINKSKSITIMNTYNSKSSKIIGIHADIKTFKDINWYKKFDIIYNCLDNNDARLFVNRRCAIIGVKMIDGGTEGWLGQSFNNGIECFDCLPKKNKKVYPICNIRQEAITFEHCLVWADVVFKENTINEIEKEIKIFLRSQTFLKNIIPSISTTNSIVASLMILSAQKNKNYYLVQNQVIFISVDLNEKKKECLTCNIPTFICEFNSLTTIKELLEEFSGSELIFDNKIFNLKTNYKLDDLSLNMDFGLLIAKNKNYNFYFKKSESKQNLKINSIKHYFLK